MKKIIISLGIIAVIAVVAVGVTRSYFSDTETSTGNTFSAGTIDIAVDGQNPWTRNYDTGDLKPGETGNINFDIQNVGQNPVNVSKNLSNFENTGGVEEYPCSALVSNGSGMTSSEPECVAEALGRVDTVQTQIIYDLSVKVYATNSTSTAPIMEQTIYTDTDGKSLTDVYGTNGSQYVTLGMIPAGGLMTVAQSYHFNPDAGNEYQGDTLSFNINLKADQMTQQITQGSPAEVDLGTVGSFAIIAKSAITDANPTLSSITGDVGIDPAGGSSITGLSCTEIHSGNILLNDAGYTGGHDFNTSCVFPDIAFIPWGRSVMEAAYTDAAGRTPGVGATNLNVGGGTLNGQNFVPGTYTWNTPGNVNIAGDITLTGGINDVWIFQITGTLNVADGGSVPTGVKVKLAGQAQAKNVFWQVVGATTLGTYSTFNGTILDQTNIEIQTGAILNGRAFAQSAVTLDGNTVTRP